MFKHIGTKTIETERLILRKFIEDDADDMYNNWASNPNVQLEYGEPVYSKKEDIYELIKKWIINYNENTLYKWAIILKENNENIGQIGFCRVYEDVATAEIEYCIGEHYWGKKYALEALNAVLEFMLNNSGFMKIEAFYRKNNPKSGKVLEKSAMIKVKNVRRYEILNEYSDDIICFAITKDKLCNFS
jgi:ribosomal-protein-alanine N-acetyltransferase